MGRIKAVSLWIGKGAATGVFSGTVGYLTKLALAKSKILDPLGSWLGDQLSVRVPDLALWAGVALGLTIWITIMVTLSRRSRAAPLDGLAAIDPRSALGQVMAMSEEEFAKLGSPPAQSPLALDVGEDGELFETKGSLYSTKRTFKVRISNRDARKTVRGITVRILSTSPATDYIGPWMLAEGLTVPAGDYHLVPLVSYGEAMDPEKFDSSDSFIQVEVARNALTINTDVATILHLRATGDDVAPADLRCRVWKENGRLRIDGVPAGDRSSVSAAIRRDVGIGEAACRIVFGGWGPSIMHHGGGFLGDIVQAVSDMRQRALDGHITIWGRTHRLGVFDKIPSEFWRENRPDELSLYNPDPDAQSYTACENNRPTVRYLDLMVSKAQIEAEWPR
ncbi:hypothetical protein [Phenylobacterium sp.]|jgi:hypothetical protein|uniref:hypothetical protein n=1 Tax=Phenylobacterium sp. TaxID=1871053 RepID=UPI002E319FEB|nr:hypothetical protein [Phenylobacterium sp.]HEX3366490.1 hypothetical protein [Phenylobacterium sp.]